MRTFGTTAMVVIMMVFGFGTALAQSTVADVLSAGGRKLTRDEVSRLFYGATTTGIQRDRPDIQFEIKTNADGTVNGKAWGAASFTMVSGRWSVNDNGQACLDLKNSSGAVIASCGHYFILGNRYYSGGQTGAPSDTVFERQIKR
jgi:hypothetical protein